MTDALDRLTTAVADRCSTGWHVVVSGRARVFLSDSGIKRCALLLIIGSLLLPLGCGDDTSGPDYATLAVTTTSLPNATATVPYSETLVATGGDGSYTWSVTVGSLPTGLSLTASTGLISGTPSVVSSETFTVQVTSGDGQTDTQQLTITVNLTLVITTTSLPNAAATVAYSETLVATGGDGSYTWSVTVGSLPTGLSLTASTGLISGTPSVVSSETFTVQVTSGDGQTDTRQLTITVKATLVLQPSELCSDYSDYFIATFEDANLEAEIRTALPVGDQEDLTCGLISGLTVLDASEAGITSLLGIQNLTSLTNLSLYENSISDISALSGLTSLDTLSLSYNSISDISGLSGLTSLLRLYLSSNSISDISALSGLTSLEKLDLWGNSISDISPLSGLTSLRVLSLFGNSISDIGALSGLTNLRVLRLHDNSISDISPLSGLTILWWLELGNNSISDISGLSGLTSLNRLYLHDNLISDISALSRLTSLNVLFLGGNSISDISGLSGLTNLTHLRLSDNSISDISALSCLTILWWLELGNNSISDISPLSGLTGLGVLYLSNNLISDIGALSGLTSLIWLYLSNNSISDISALSGLTSLTWLYLDNNPNLTDIQPLLDNTGLGAGDVVYLQFTSVSCSDVAALEAKGVWVFSDCP